jgi:hypothetical protein
MDFSEVVKSTQLMGPEVSLILAGIVLIVLDPITKESVLGRSGRTRPRFYSEPEEVRRRLVSVLGFIIP